MLNHQSNNTNNTAPLTDEHIDHAASQYHACPKLRTRVTFAEFIRRPDFYLKHVDSWPEREWSIDFVPYGSHQKMWVNDCLTGATIRVDVVRENEYQTIIGKLDAIAQANGKPNAVVIGSAEGFNTDTARAWCRINGVLILRPRVDKPQLIDAFGAEAVA